jgi:hypothetical protein
MDKNIARLLYKRDLQHINNLKVIFRKIRDYLAGNLTGITGDESIARQMMFLLFCKIHDEQTKAAGELLDFSFAVVQATISTLGNRILEVVLPASSDKKEVSLITNEVREIIEQKTGLRERCMRLIDNSI